MRKKDITTKWGGVLFENGALVFKHTEAIMNRQTFAQFVKLMWADQNAVTSIEYALFGSLIAVVIVGAVGALSTNVLTLFGLVANCVTFATMGTGSCA
jgi:Flp pilus assembly pilin Flp